MRGIGEGRNLGSAAADFLIDAATGQTNPTVPAQSGQLRPGSLAIVLGMQSPEDRPTGYSNDVTMSAYPAFGFRAVLPKPYPKEDCPASWSSSWAGRNDAVSESVLSSTLKSPLAPALMPPHKRYLRLQK